MRREPTRGPCGPAPAGPNSPAGEPPNSPRPPGVGDRSESGKFLRALRDALHPGLIRLPPLRERTEDIPLLLHHYLFESNRERKKPLRGFSEAALSALTSYSWPGNVEELVELVNLISSRKRQGSVVDAADLPPENLDGRTPQA